MMLLIKSFIPHINNIDYTNILKMKGIYICYMLNKLFSCYLGRIEPDDRDSCENKRICVPGETMLDTTIKTHKKMLNESMKIFWKSTQGTTETINIINSINPAKVFKALTSMLSKSSSETQTGVAMRLERITLIQSLVYLRSITSPNASESMSKITAPRMFHPSQTGFIDANDSPEHKNIGLTKHLSLLGSITMDDEYQTKLVYEEIIKDILFKHINNHTITDLMY